MVCSRKLNEEQRLRSEKSRTPTLTNVILSNNGRSIVITARQNILEILRTPFETAYLKVRRYGPPDWSFAIGAVFRNEARYLAEWIEFHELMGVEHFFLYDDESTDNFLEVLQPWIDKGSVTLRKAEGRGQFSVYDHCLRHGARRSRWIAFIDIDEFLFSPTGQTLPEVMERYADYPGVFVHWLLFGSSGHKTAPPGGTIRNFTKTIGVEGSIRDRFVHEPGTDKSQRVTGRAIHGKSIVDPRAIVWAGVHFPRRKLLWGHVVTERFERPQRPWPAGTPFTCDILRINHYWTRSIEEFQDKLKRGFFRQDPNVVRSLERHLERESQLNQVEDREILRVVETLQQANREGGRASS